MGDNDVGGGEDIHGGSLVDDLPREIFRRKSGQSGDPGVERDSRVFAPDPSYSNLDDPPLIIEAKSLNRQFDDAIGVAVEPSRLHIDRGPYST